ncbi:MAG: rhamnulokinase [Clostridiales bacterium]|jgi:rhamnulokinase|nr:rhamnulokinase [Clostridiales bacterium]
MESEVALTGADKLMNTYVAIDLGASGGKILKARINADGVLVTEEVHRFNNKTIKSGAYLCWDVDYLFAEIISGLARLKGEYIVSVGVDTWGVDYVLLDEDGERIGLPVCYRDERTSGMDKVLAESLPGEQAFALTGIQPQIFNTVYQLMAMARQQPEELSRAKTMLLLPDYLHYRLTGKISREYTNATTTGLVNALTKQWDDSVIAAAGLPKHIFGPICRPGAIVGKLGDAIRQAVGFGCQVILPCTHDTASAVLSAPLDGESLFLSAGTWCLMGAELDIPILSADSMRAGFTNEGGYGGAYRFLKNIMGLWIVQNLKKEYKIYSYPDLSLMAAQSNFASRVDVNSQRFFAPGDMLAAVRSACRETGQPVPDQPKDVMHVVYHSLSESIAASASEIERLTNRSYRAICIVGGGSRDEYFCKLVAEKSGKLVITGPAEGTAAGNIYAQMLAMGEINSAREARELTRRSFDIRQVSPA